MGYSELPFTSRKRNTTTVNLDIFGKTFPGINRDKTRTCAYCKKDYPISHFDGFSTTCRECRVMLDILYGEYDEDEEAFNEN